MRGEGVDGSVKRIRGLEQMGVFFFEFEEIESASKIARPGKILENPRKLFLR